MKILITGGAGYIGSILVEKLIKNEHEVYVYDSFLYKQNSLNHLCIYNNLHIIKGDVRNISNLENLIKKVDIIIPLAALVGAPLCSFDPIGSKSINYDAVLLMLKKLSKNQVVLMPTTNSAYGTSLDNKICNEESDLNPVSLYAKDKVDLEKRLMDFDNSISFRLATVFGMSPRMRTDLLVNDFTYRAVHDGFIVIFEGSFKRNYIHIRDVAEVFNFAINNFEKMKSNIYNVGLSDANISKIELAKKIQKFIPNFIIKENEYQKDPDQRNYIVSNEKIEQTGYKPKFNLEVGIEELIKGYKMIKNNIYGNY
jgi:nucleoside-diphosphate-sugar epimerase